MAEMLSGFGLLLTGYGIFCLYAGIGWRRKFWGFAVGTFGFIVLYHGLALLVVS